MSNKKKNIDQYISGKIGNTQVPVGDSDWNAILQGLSQAPTKKKIAWWWLLLTAVLVPMSWFIYSSITPGQSNSEKHKTRLSKNQTTSVSQNSNSQTNNLNPSTLSKASDTHSQSAPDVKGKEGLKLGHPQPIYKSKNAGNSGAIKPKTEQTEPKDMEAGALPNQTFRTEMMNLLPRLQVNLKSQVQPWIPTLEAFIEPIHPFVDKTIDLPNIRKPGWSIGAYTSLNRYSQSHLSQDPTYDNYRNAAESPSVSLEGGFIAQYNTGKWTYASGAIYSPKTQWLKGQIRYMIYDSFPHLNPQGEIIGYFRLNYRDTTATMDQRVTHTFMDIPVQIGREIPIGQKSSIIPSVGVMISFLTDTKGQSIGPNLGLHQVSDLSIFDYKKSMQSLQADIKYRYYIKPGWSVNTGLQYKHGISSLTQDASVEQKFRQLGWLFEFQYQF